MTYSTQRLITNTIFSAISGAIAATAIIEFSILTVLVWIVVLAIFLRKLTSRDAFALGSSGVIVFGVIMAAAAVYRPAKSVDQLLNKNVTLPAKQMTLAELATSCYSNRIESPRRINFSFLEAKKDQVIHFPKKQIALREFVHAIETQSTLRCRFSHCGNGYTVLNGGDCYFGVFVSDPNLSPSDSSQLPFGVDSIEYSRKAP